MAGREAVKKAVQQVRPILSVNRDEARKRAINLYKAWYRQIPYIGTFLFLLIMLCHHGYGGFTQKIFSNKEISLFSHGL